MYDTNYSERGKKLMDMFKLIAMIAELAAKAGAGSASLAGCYQPAEPKNIKVTLKK